VGWVPPFGLDRRPGLLRHLYQAETALEQLRGTVDLNADLIDAFGFTRPSDVPQMAALIAHQHDTQHAGVLERWVTTENWQALADDRAALGDQIGRVKAAEEVVVADAGVPWTALPDPLTSPPSPGPVSAACAPVDIRELSECQHPLTQ